MLLIKYLWGLMKIGLKVCVGYREELGYFFFDDVFIFWNIVSYVGYGVNVI